MRWLLPLLLLGPAWAQDAPPVEPAPAPVQDAAAPDQAAPEAAAPDQAAPDAAAPDEAAPPQAAPAQDAAGDDTGAVEAPAAPPPPWTVIPVEERVADGVPVLGPWPDGWVPERSAKLGLPGIDPILGDIIDPGRPVVHGPTEGPSPPVEMLGPYEAPATSPEEPPQALERPETRSQAGDPVDADPASPVPTTGGDLPAAPASTATTAAGAAPAAASTASTADSATERRRSIAEDFLPPPPRSGPRRAIGFLLLGLLSILLSALAERLQDRVRNTGIIPRLLSMLTGVGRGVAVPLMLVAFLAVLPRSWSLAVPFALVAVALALGWSARDLIGDIFAGVVLTVERRIRQGDRLEVDSHRGIVHGLGLRSTRITVDDGRMVSIPNRRLLATDMRVDPDHYAPVVVPVMVQPHLSVGEVRQTLQELALLSPYVAPSRPPNVYRDADRREVWIVEARLVHPRYANAFRGALVELADEQFGVLSGGDVDGPAVDADVAAVPLTPGDREG